MMDLRMSRLKTEHILLFLILLWGTVLRTRNLADICFTHDELAVVFRSGYNSFHELIRDAVIPDVHPAGVQVFMNYWIGLFGSSETAVKLPFIVSGILSIFLVWLLAREWFSEDAALVSAVFVGGLEYFVMHSQTARPYASGLFFSLLMVYAWQRYLFRPGRPWSAWLIIYVLASSACAYNHYFSLMFAALVGGTGLLFLSRRKVIPYLTACLGIFILFIPHLGIFFSQLSQKGLGNWLGKPGNDYIFDYLAYVFHFSPWIAGILALIFLAGIVSGRTLLLLRSKYLYISLAWFFIPYLTAFFYSRYVDAVLQYRAMIFFFPFLLFALTGMLPRPGPILKWLVPLVIMGVLTTSLVLERRYYDLYDHSPYSGILEETAASLESRGEGNCTAIIDSHERITGYYMRRMDLHFDFTKPSRFDTYAEIDEWLRRLDTHYISYGSDSRQDKIVPVMVMDHYPHIERKVDFQGGYYYLFSDEDRGEQSYPFSVTCDFDTPADGWSAPDPERLADSAGVSGNGFLYDSVHEFGPALGIPLHSILDNKNDWLDVAVSVRNLGPGNLGPGNQAMVVLSLENETGILDWSAGSFADFDPHSADWYRVYHTYRPGRNFKFRDAVIKVYVWNRGKDDFMIDDFRLRARHGNPVLYGLTEKI